MKKKLEWKFIKPLKKIPQSRFDQEKGKYSKDEPCCFGSHLAHVLIDRYDYEEGREEFKKRLGGINNLQVSFLFQKAGLIVDPFGVDDWNLPVKQVIENLEKIKEIPKTENTTLQNLQMPYFEDGSFKNSHLINCDFTYLVINRVNFENCIIENCDFTENSIKNSRFKNTTFRTCCFEKVYIYKNNYIENVKFENGCAYEEDFRK